MLRRLNVLVSYGTLGARCAEVLRPDWDVLLDSGAFTNFNAKRDVVTLPAYANFLTEYGRGFWRYMNLDKIGDGDTGRRHFEMLRARGLTPVPVYQRGSPLSELVDMGHASDLVGVGGLATKGRTGKVDFIHAVSAFARARGIRLHLLGSGHFQRLKTVRPFSSDCSDHNDVGRYGNIRIWDPRRRVDVDVRGYASITHPKATPMSLELAQIMKFYGITLAQWRDRDWWSSAPGRRVALLARFHKAECLERLGVKFFIAVGDAEETANVWDEYVAARAA